MKTAVIVVHGVCPTPRYQIQDAFATEFAARLNERMARGKRWRTSILWPPISTPNAGPGDVHATALRIWQDGDTPDDPQRDAFDIFEGYWSPIDKNQTTPQSVLLWMSRALFAPLNASAKLYAGFWKTFFDLGFVFAMFIIALGLLIAAARVGVSGYNIFAQAAVALKCLSIANAVEHQKCLTQVPSIIDMVLHPTTVLPGFAMSAIGYLVTIFIGAFALTQLIVSIYFSVSEWRRRANLSLSRRGLSAGRPGTADPGAYQWWRAVFWVLLAIIAFLGLWYVPFWRPFVADPHHDLAWATIEMVAFVALVRGAWSVLDGFFVNFLGDVQIYTTHDENARFYQLRKQIVATVEAIILQVLRANDAPATTIEVPAAKAVKAVEEKPAPLYERVFVMGHSLGSTISMDAILSVHELYAENGLDAEAWKRLRGFVSFGAALEKTKFFFDVRQPSVSVSPDHWRSDVYGQLFTEDCDVLGDDNNEDGIFWANYWYFNDIVANEIASYRSAIRVGKAAHAHGARAKERVVCANARLPSKFMRPPWHAWIHSDYLGDDRFWYSGPDHDGRAYRGVCDLLIP